MDHEFRLKCLTLAHKHLFDTGGHTNLAKMMHIANQIESFCIENQFPEIKDDAQLHWTTQGFNFSPRCLNTILNENLDLQDLLRLSDRALLKFSNFGQTSLRELDLALAQRGYARSKLVDDWVR